MTKNCTMKFTKYLICIVVLVIYAQNTEAKDVYRQLNSIEEINCAKYALAKTERDLRGIKDVWAKVKESAINSWNYIKTVAETTKEKIKEFMENVKEHANELKTNFEKQLEELKAKFTKIISDLYGTGELVKQCIKNDQENMEDILKQLIAQMGECIAEEINKLTQFNNDKPEPVMNETKFVKELDEKMDFCERDVQNVQECLCNVRRDIFDNFTDMENDILKNHFDSRNIADDIKGTLVACSIDNLISATNLISAEIVDIAKCVLEAKENQEPSD